MNPDHIKYILENMKKKPAAQIAADLGLRERDVKKILRMEREKGGFHCAAGHEAPAEVVATAPAPKAAGICAGKTFVLVSVALGDKP